jgi:hypothetical protein
MSEVGHERPIRIVRDSSAYPPDFVAELDEEQLAGNIRIEATEFLNQHCAWALGLESILRAGPLKIVLQQAIADIRPDIAFRRSGP